MGQSRPATSHILRGAELGIPQLFTQGSFSIEKGLGSSIHASWLEWGAVCQERSPAREGQSTFLSGVWRPQTMKVAPNS